MELIKGGHYINGTDYKGNRLICKINSIDLYIHVVFVTYSIDKEEKTYCWDIAAFQNEWKHLPGYGTPLWKAINDIERSKNGDSN